VFSCGTIGNGGDGGDNADGNDLLLVLPTGDIVATFVPVVPETAFVLLLFVVAICCCCFGAAAAAAVGFVVVVCCGVVDDTAVDEDVDGAGDDNSGDFIVFGIPHISDSVVLTALRLGLLGSHIFALSCGDIVAILSPPSGDDWRDAIGVDDEDDCCAYT
jgi:hypothetical protein